MKFIGNEEDLCYPKEEMMAFLEEAIKNKDKYLEHFLELLDLDKDMFHHLFEIDMFLDATPEANNGTQSAFFLSQDQMNNGDPSIHVPTYYIEMLMDEMQEHDESKKSAFYNLAAIVLLHETIHYNRCIIVNNSITLQETEIPAPSGIEIFKKHYDEMESLLSRNYDPNKEYIVLKVIRRENDIVASVFNNNDNTFADYIFPFEIYKNTNMQDILDNLEETIKIAETEHLPFPLKQNRISLIERESIPAMVMHMDTENKDRLTYPLNNQEMKKENKLIKSQIGIEEALTEALAMTIFFARKEDSIESRKIYELLDNNSEDYDVKLASQMLGTWDKEMFRWFMLSCYEEYYDDRLASTYGDKYEQLKVIFDYLYNSDESHEIINRVFYEDGLKTVQKK